MTEQEAEHEENRASQLILQNTAQSGQNQTKQKPCSCFLIGAINPTRFTISQNFLIAFVVIGAQIQMHREPLYQPVCVFCCLAVTCCVQAHAHVCGFVYVQ